MLKHGYKHFVMGVLLIAVAGLTVLATPKANVIDVTKQKQLANIIPSQFNDWQVQDDLSPIVVDPSIKEHVDTLYSQTLSRTYINSQGARVMLSIAYGGVANKALHAHRPEVCYAAQGFQVGHLYKTDIVTPVGTIPVMRLDAQRGTRDESITYWIRVGNYLTRGIVEQNLAQISYGLRGRWSDGELVRISTINIPPAQAAQVQQQFISALLIAMQPQDRSMLIGNKLQ